MQVWCSTRRAAGSSRQHVVQVLDQLVVLDTLGFLEQQPDLNRGKTPQGLANYVGPVPILSSQSVSLKNHKHKT